MATVTALIHEITAEVNLASSLLKPDANSLENSVIKILTNFKMGVGLGWRNPAWLWVG